MPPSTDVVLDLVAAYPHIGVLKAALARRDWPACRQAIGAVPLDSRTGMIRVASGDDEKRGGNDLEGFLRDVLRRDPDDGAAAALLGEHLIGVGWAIRTSAAAKDVSAEQFAAFHEWLGRAEEVLIEGAARNPRDPAVWTVRLLSARGLSLGLAEARRRYERAVAADPHHLPAQRQLMHQLAPKWGGSWEELHTFARDAMRAAPAGGAHGVLVAEGHAEHLLTVLREKRDLNAVAAYLHDPAIRDELYEAARRSIGDPGFRRTYGWLEAASTFAFVFRLMEDRAATAWPLRLLGDLGTAYPWTAVFRDVPEAFRDVRVWAQESAA
ncbi:hypothetical protein [Actinoplanes subglobosus]|uniref:DUF4034 domain-containing protein n=1 Tax=Actinoplanes subglobosus TaxID=1547892 RepID=A0ABV8J5F6_9ACTN